MGNDKKGASWYLVRTKQHKESLVRQVLSTRGLDIFLPLLRTTRNHWGRIEETIEPLFPTYIFAFFDLEAQYFAVQWTPGVVGLVRAGDEPSEVDPRIIDQIKSRTSKGVLTLVPKKLQRGEPVNLADGPLRGLVAVFERYLSGRERVALLLELVGGATLRVIAPTSRVNPISS
jgi:transcriptional antiterminator RfaH